MAHQGERYFEWATAEQLTAAAAACRRAAAMADEDRDAPEAEEARRLTHKLGWVWDFQSWSHAAGFLEHEATLAAN